ncbi:hypothetical protein ABZ357_18400 [Streptomyces sp. NPDC005917]|uniref:hypothetical protein n=1 Tax=unclassified Streptomyces TaxID=2593676 RepID=UPI0033C832FF
MEMPRQPVGSAVVGPAHGSARLDCTTGADATADESVPHDPDRDAWRTWVDEVLASWAACLLSDREPAGTAVTAPAAGARPTGPAAGFRRLVEPEVRDLRAAALLRHPDLLAPVSDLHRPGLVGLLCPGRTEAA